MGFRGLGFRGDGLQQSGAKGFGFGFKVKGFEGLWRPYCVSNGLTVATFGSVVHPSALGELEAERD